MIQHPFSEDSNSEAEFGSGIIDVDKAQTRLDAGMDLSEEELDAITARELGGGYLDGENFIR